MPTSAPKICSHAGCSALVTVGYRCELHIKLSGWDGNETRYGNRHERGYGTKWEKLRKRILKRDNYLCVTCFANNVMTAANAVDHIVAKADGGTDNSSNLQAICNHCHNIKTGKESN